jgi:hypothetical protein
VLLIVKSGKNLVSDRGKKQTYVNGKMSIDSCPDRDDNRHKIDMSYTAHSFLKDQSPDIKRKTNKNTTLLDQFNLPKNVFER